MYKATWYEFVCPKCNSTNFVNDGDTQDLTVPDIEGCKCRVCSYCFDFEGEAVNEDNCYCEDGQNLCNIK